MGEAIAQAVDRRTLLRLALLAAVEKLPAKASARPDRPARKVVLATIAGARRKETVPGWLENRQCSLGSLGRHVGPRFRRQVWILERSLPGWRQPSRPPRRVAPEDSRQSPLLNGAVRTSRVRRTQKPRCRGQRGFCLVRRTLKLRMRTGEPIVWCGRRDNHSTQPARTGRNLRTVRGQGYRQRIRCS